MIPYANYSNISITDFGNSSTWRLPSGKHRACARINSAPSFRSFSSIHVQQGRTASYRDDLCSLGYTLVYAARQSLPWMDSTKSEMEREKHIETLQLCAGLPPALAVLIAEARSLLMQCQTILVSGTRLQHLLSKRIITASIARIGATTF